MILLTKTYSVVSEDSDAEPDESGFVFAHSPHSFREVVALLRTAESTSHWPAAGSTWEYALLSDDVDMHSGNETRESLHFSHQNLPRAAKYWRKAFIAAGLTKESI